MVPISLPRYSVLRMRLKRSLSATLLSPTGRRALPPTPPQGGIPPLTPIKGMLVTVGYKVSRVQGADI